MLLGAKYIKKECHKHNIEVVMPRSIYPALATLLALRGMNCSMVFDADGLALDERVDFAGQKPTSFVHRLLRDIEAQAVLRADVVLTRSSKASEILHARAGAGNELVKFHTVTNGRDVETFKPANIALRAQTRQELGLDVKAPLLIYAGSLGAQYCVEEMLLFFALIHDRIPEAHLLILTSTPEFLAQSLGKYPLLQESIIIRSVLPLTVPLYLSCADLGLALRQPSFSMQAVAPIKLGEYLLCGLPVIATKGIGDTQAVAAEVAYFLSHIDDSTLLAAADWFINSVLPNRESYRTACRARGLNLFSLDNSALLYRKAFESLGIAS